MSSKKDYENVFGTWRVTTEGDCEGRSIRDLGVHTGYVDAIAFSLADKSCYSLQFEAVVIPVKHKPTATKVNVTLGIASGTWDLSPDERAAHARKLFKDRNVRVERGQYYASFTLVAGKDRFEEEERARQIAIDKARAKLSEEEQELLGLK